MVMVTIITGVIFLPFNCMHIWVWRILRRWSATAESLRNIDLYQHPNSVASHMYCYCFGVISYKASHALRRFSGLLCVPHLTEF
jgi:hypothetical protein